MSETHFWWKISDSNWDYLDSGLHYSNYCCCKCARRADICRYLIVNCRFAIYPLLKRCTHWLQAWLGLYGTLVVYKHIGSSLIQVNLDTVYACQDIKDDVKMGVRSTAILFGSWIRPLLVLCGLTFVTMLAIVGHLNNQGPAYFTVSVGGTLVHLLWQYNTVDLDIPKSCWSESFFFPSKISSILGLILTKEIFVATANLDGLCGED